MYYENYESLEELSTTLVGLSEKLQCVVGATGYLPQAVPFGAAQYPRLDDFADGVDTMAFLENL